MTNKPNYFLVYGIYSSLFFSVYDYEKMMHISEAENTYDV